MTDRHIAYTVVLEKPVREDDAEAIVQALSMVKGVRQVVPLVATIEQYVATETARGELLNALIQFVCEWRKDAAKR